MVVCLWVNFDCKKLPHRDSQNAEGSDNFSFSLGNQARLLIPTGGPLLFPLLHFMPWFGNSWLVTA